VAAGAAKNENLIGQPGFLDMSRKQQAIFAPIAAELARLTARQRALS
jgi:hypothetical protein